MNILYIGSSGVLSLLPFKIFLSQGCVNDYSLSAVGVFNPILLNNKVIALETESLSLLANQHDINIIDLSQPVVKIVKQLKKLSIDIILMSCYSKRLPSEIFNFPKLGCFNMHPSLLPAYRGPEPVFWQMKNEAEMGVSWHQVVKRIDAGNICLQKRILVDEGASYAQINTQIAEVGATLMLELLANSLIGVNAVEEQDVEKASYYPYPKQIDFTVDVNWTARHAYNFMCASKAFSHSYQCLHDGRTYSLLEANDYDNNASLEYVEVKGDRLYIPFKEGVLIAVYTDKIAH